MIMLTRGYSFTILKSQQHYRMCTYISMISYKNMHMNATEVIAVLQTRRKKSNYIQCQVS